MKYDAGLQKVGQLIWLEGCERHVRCSEAVAHYTRMELVSADPLPSHHISAGLFFLLGGGVSAIFNETSHQLKLSHSMQT